MQFEDDYIFRLLGEKPFCTPGAAPVCGNSDNCICNKPTANRGEDPFFRTLNGQILATAVLIAAGVVNLYVLYGQKEQHEHPNNLKDYSYLKSLPRASVIALLVVSAYFMYVAYIETGYKKSAPYYWTLFASILLFSSAVIKTGVAFGTPSTEAEAEAAE